MISDPNDNPVILYACVAKGPTVLAEISSAAAAGDLAAQYLAATPRLHRLYSHTAGGRIYAFLMEDPLIFFAIADESLGKPQVFLFLRRLRDVFFASSAIAIGGADDPLTPLCFQDEFLPELRRLVLPFSSQVDKPPPRPPPPDSPPSVTGGSMTGKETEKEIKKEKEVKMSTEEDSISSIASYDSDAESRIEISVADADPKTKTVQGVWGQHLRMVVLIDLALCSLLFGIWLSVCRGFHCIGS